MREGEREDLFTRPIETPVLRKFSFLLFVLFSLLLNLAANVDLRVSEQEVPKCRGLSCDCMRATQTPCPEAVGDDMCPLNGKRMELK